MSSPVPPRAFDPKNLNDWINVLHHATAVPDGHADYAEAQEVKQEALRRIDHLNRAANVQDRNAAEKGPSSLVASTVLPAMHGVSLGIGEPLAGAIEYLTPSAMGGGSFRDGAQQFREGMDRLQASHPTASATAELAGMVAPIGAPARAAVGAIEAGVPLTLAQSVGRLLRGSATGATVGGVSGFSTGGEDPGSLDQRLTAGADAAKVGAVVGGILTGGAMYMGRNAAERAADLTQRADTRRAASLKAELLQEKLNRARSAPADAVPAVEVSGVVQPLAVAGRAAVHPDVIAATRDFEAGKISGDDLRTAMDFARNGALRPQEAVARVGNLRRSVGEELAQAGPPQGPPSPPRQGFWDPAHPNVVPPNMAARETLFGAPDKPFQELYGHLEAPPQFVEPASPLPKISQPDIKVRPDLTVTTTPGQYQRAAPASRMQSMGNNLWNEAIKMAGKEPKLLETLPTDFLQSQLGLAQSFGTDHPDAIQAVIAELAKRGVAQ